MKHVWFIEANVNTVYIFNMSSGSTYLSSPLSGRELSKVNIEEKQK